MKKPLYENSTEWFKAMSEDVSKRTRYFLAFLRQLEQVDIDKQIHALIGNIDIEQKIKLHPNPEDQRYAVITATKSTDGRAYTYAIVDLKAQTKEESFCQFDDYTDLFIELSLHFKLGREDEMVAQAVSLIIGGAKRKTNGRDS